MLDKLNEFCIKIIDMITPVNMSNGEVIQTLSIVAAFIILYFTLKQNSKRSRNDFYIKNAEEGYKQVLKLESACKGLQTLCDNTNFESNKNYENLGSFEKLYLLNKFTKVLDEYDPIINELKFHIGCHFQNIKLNDTPYSELQRHANKKLDSKLVSSEPFSKMADIEKECEQLKKQFKAELKKYNHQQK